MSLSKRTLQNHLKASGASFQGILDRVRSDIASNYLAESNVSMTYLADMLGYSELSAFPWAFKRWFGMPPRGWKAIAWCFFVGLKLLILWCLASQFPGPNGAPAHQ